jgi:hypothetical protein
LHYPDWQADLLSARQESDGTLAVGSSASGVREAGPRKLTRTEEPGDGARDRDRQDGGEGEVPRPDRVARQARIDSSGTGRPRLPRTTTVKMAA